MYKSAEAHGENMVEKALRSCKRGGTLLDVGCWDGANTLRWSSAFGAKKTLGIEVVSAAAKKASNNGIKVYVADIDNDKWPIKSGSVDCVISNLVIEHMSNVDHFISETYRVLKSGGYSVVGTNNLSSWHNIASLFLGWTPFDLTNTTSKQWSIGNPLALHLWEKRTRGDTYMHKCVYSTRWLKEWYELYGFSFVSVYGSGYYPFPSFIGDIDKLHASLITLTFKK